MLILEITYDGYKPIAIVFFIKRFIQFVESLQCINL